MLAVLTFICLATVASSVQSEEASRASDPGENKGRKFVNKIPYDVFFDRPLEIAKDNRTESNSSKSVAAQGNSDDRNRLPASPAGTRPKTAWSELLPIEGLQDEIKTLRGNLTKHLSNQGQYNQNFKSIVIDATGLAALAVIAQNRHESLTWTENAAYVREFANQIAAAATGLGRENYGKTKSAFQRLTTVLDGSIPADSGDVVKTISWHEAVSRHAAMKRIESARDYLKQDVNSESKFKSMSERVRHESAIIAAFTTLIASDGYEFAENEDYQQFAKMLIEGAKEAIDSTSVQSYEKFKTAIDKINKSCTDCHGHYGNG